MYGMGWGGMGRDGMAKAQLIVDYWLLLSESELGLKSTEGTLCTLMLIMVSIYYSVP